MSPYNLCKIFSFQTQIIIAETVFNISAGSAKVNCAHSFKNFIFRILLFLRHLQKVINGYYANEANIILNEEIPLAIDIHQFLPLSHKFAPLFLLTEN